MGLQTNCFLQGAKTVFAVVEDSGSDLDIAGLYSGTLNGHLFRGELVYLKGTKTFSGVLKSAQQTITLNGKNDADGVLCKVVLVCNKTHEVVATNYVALFVIQNQIHVPLGNYTLVLAKEKQHGN